MPTFQLEAAKNVFHYWNLCTIYRSYFTFKFLAQLATESRRNQWRRKNMVIAIARDCLKTLIRNENKFRAIFLANKKIIDEININSSGGSSRVLALSLSLFLIGLGSLFFSLFLWKSHGFFLFSRQTFSISVSHSRAKRKKANTKKIVKFCRRKICRNIWAEISSSSKSFRWVVRGWE